MHFVQLLYNLFLRCIQNNVKLKQEKTPNIIWVMALLDLTTPTIKKFQSANSYFCFRDPSVKRTLCKKCCSLLIPGVSATTRQRSKFVLQNYGSRTAVYIDHVRLLVSEVDLICHCNVISLFHLFLLTLPLKEKNVNLASL